MADSEKGNLTTDSKKKTTALDEDLGNDFLSFWGSSKKGKDDIDFDMEDVPQNKKKSFNFDKLDDFELDRDFDKLSSFKVDIPELDFSSPAMNNAKPTEKPIGKKDSKNEKFSFNFDFNELDRFDLDSSPAEDKKKPSKHADSTDYSFKHVWNQDSKSKSDTSTDMFKDQGNTKPQNADITASSRPQSLIAVRNIRDPRPSVSEDLEHHDASSREVKTSTANQITVADENNDETHSKGHIEQTQETRFIRTNVERTTQDFILESPGDCSAQVDNPQVETSPPSLDDVRAAAAKEQEDSMRTVDSSQSRNSSPTKSYNTRYCPETSMIKSPNASDDNQKICKWNKNEVTGGKEALSESTHGQMGFQNVALFDFSQNIANRMNYPEDKINSGMKFILSPLRRDARAVKPKSLNDKLAASLRLNSLNISAENATRKTSSATERELDNIHINKLKSSNICPVKENRGSSQNHKQAETSMVDMSKSHGEDSKGISDASRSEKDNNQNNTSR